MNIGWDGKTTAPTVSSTAVATTDSAAAVEDTASSEKTMGVYTLEEVAKHKSEDDCWCIINGKVYDITKFLPDHPGGKKAPLLLAGGDATEEFDMLHKPEILDKYAGEYLIGTVAEAPSSKL